MKALIFRLVLPLVLLLFVAANMARLSFHLDGNDSARAIDIRKISEMVSDHKVRAVLETTMASDESKGELIYSLKYVLRSGAFLIAFACGWLVVGEISARKSSGRTAVDQS